MLEIMGNIGSLVGVIIALVGFAITIVVARRSRSAAVQAKEAVQSVRGDLQLLNSTSDLSSALAIIDEIQRLQRNQAWSELPDRYNALRRTLLEVRASGHSWPDEHKTSIQSAVTLVASIQRQLEYALSQSSSDIRVPRLNTQLARREDELIEVLGYLRQQIGR